MIKKLILSSLSVALLASAASAATIAWSAITDNGFSKADGTDLAAGNLIRLGVFDVTDAEIAANATNLTYLNSHFTLLSSGKIGDGTADLAHPNGYNEIFARSDTMNTAAVAGAQLYLWVFASTDITNAATSFATATQQGIFAMDKAVKTSWAVPVQTPVQGSTSIDITDLTNAAGTALASGARVIVGSFPKGTTEATGGAPGFGLQAIPEPSTTGLAILGGIALLARRRRMS